MTISAQTASRSLHSVRLRVLSFSTGEILQKALASAFSAAHYDAQVSCAGFGTVVAELLNPDSDHPDAIIIQVDAKGLHKRDWRQSSDEAQRHFEERTGMFLSALERFAQERSTPILINSLPSPVSPSAGFLDFCHPDGAIFLTREFNHRLGESAHRCNQITVIDTDHAMAHIAPTKRSDAKLWFYGRIPYSAEGTQALATSFAQAYAATRSPPAKVLALDLDNTVWRGTYGEDGLHGLECGDDFPGNAFKAFQEECLRLKGQGLLLTILSKNNEDVLRVFDDHPGMALTRDDIVAYRINWEPKAQNIRSLANELGVGIDSFVFLDDSPHEREAMRRMAPEVRVPELPDDPAVRIEFLRNDVSLWPFRLTPEDRTRSELYLVQSKGRALKNESVSLDEYLESLAQHLCVEGMTQATLPRVAQMHARTNQFNLTTRRLSESELATMITDPRRHKIVLGRLSDRFGDHGIVVCACVQISGTHANIETLLMSCRVIGRGVEHAFLGALVRDLVVNGIESVEGSFIPTKKNAPAKDFYEMAGFALQGRSETGTGSKTNWVWQKTTHACPGPKFISVEITDKNSSPPH